MIHLGAARAGASRVVTGYVHPGIQLDRGARKRSSRGYTGFRIRLDKLYVEQIRAVTRCIGASVGDFAHCALVNLLNATAKEIGMDPRDIAKLSRRQRLEIQNKYVSTVEAMSKGMEMARHN